MIRLTFKKGKRERSVDLPESWDEVQGDHVPGLLFFLSTQTADLAVLNAIKTILPKAIFKDLNESAIAEIARLMSWYKVEAFPDPLIRSFEFQGERYHLPAANFSNGTAIEYPLADEFYMNTISGEADESIHLAATLCRPEKADPKAIITTGDPRIPLKSRAEVDARAEQFKRLPVHLVTNAILYFAGIKKKCPKCTPPLYSARKKKIRIRKSRKRRQALISAGGVYIWTSLKAAFSDAWKTSIRRTFIRFVSIYLKNTWKPATANAAGIWTNN